MNDRVETSFDFGYIISCNGNILVQLGSIEFYEWSYSINIIDFLPEEWSDRGMYELDSTAGEH